MYLKFNYKIFFVLLFVFIFVCCNTERKNEESEVLLPFKAIDLKYAKRFSIASMGSDKVLFLFGSNNPSDTTSVFVLYKDKKPELKLKNTYYIQVPVKNIASLSSIYSAMLNELKLADKIVAIENADYYNNDYLVQQVREGKIKEIAKTPEVNTELALQVNPGLVMMFGMGNPKQDAGPKLLESGIPVAVSLDHLEAHPLARAEWIKFVAAFFEKETMADSLFNITEKKYNELKKLCDTVTYRPTVLTEIKYSDAWYVPGGNSFMANLLKDAGADYIWKNENKTGSIPLNFEQVYTAAKDADLWINLFVNVNSKKDLLSFDERYNMFKAFQNGKLYNNNLRVNKQGFSDYWESGMVHPDELLQDLIKIIHPDLIPRHEMKYYKKIN